jgi:hypothetical protein
MRGNSWSRSSKRDSAPCVGEIDGPAVECGRTFVRAEVIVVEHLGVPHHVEDDRVTLVIGVHRVEHVARFHVEPAHVGIAALPRDYADAGRVFRVPRVREPPV